MRLLIEAANTTIAIEDGKIIEPGGSFDRIVRSSGEIRPGLINAHDHLHRNHYGRLGAPPYENAQTWARDIQHRHAAGIARGRAVPRRAALLAGAWKNLLAGVTHVVHHDPWESEFEVNFPINVVRIANADHGPEVIGVRAIRDLEQAEVSIAIVTKAVGLRHHVEPPR